MVALAAFALGAARAWAAPGTHAAEHIAARPHEPRIAIAIVPQRISPARLARVDHMAIGLASAGIGAVSPAQTFIDVSQGARLFDSLYDESLPLVYERSGARGQAARIEPQLWRRVRRRAASVPADLDPGLLGSTLERAGVPTHADVLAGPAAAIVVDRAGRVSQSGRCASRICPGVSVVSADLKRLRVLASRLRDDDLLIAIEQPPPAARRQLAIGIAGRGFRGMLTSDSTRMRGLVLSTDVAATILHRLGLPIPDSVEGQPIHSEGTADPAYLRELERRLAAISPRRGPVVGSTLLIWVAVTALAGLVAGTRGLRAALPLLAVSIAYLPALLLLTAALEPSELAERLIAGLGAPALAAMTVRLAGGYGALAIAGAVSTLGYAVDVIAGSKLTEVSLIGPNPALGVRFYGIGNELEATVAALVPIATGAGLAAWAPRTSPRRAALAFGATAVLAVAAFAPGRFGADVGAAIGIPVGAAVAAAVCLGGGRRRVLWLLAAPIAALAALAAADLVLGGDSHLTRSVLRAGGLDQLAQVAERRLRLSASSFSHYADSATLWIAVLLIGAGIVQRRRIQGWFGEPRYAWAGFVGAAAATAVGTLANDSGALLLMVGTTIVAGTAGLAWAVAAPREAPD